eukprot:COSAG06_NODE_15813_length_1042_cov_16.311771_1_plen_118_part_10
MCEPGRNNGTHPLVMAWAVFDMASLVAHIAQYIEMEDMQMSFKGINMACHDAYQQRLKAFKEQPAADQLAYLLKLMAQGKSTAGTLLECVDKCVTFSAIRRVAGCHGSPFCQFPWFDD